MPHHCTQEEEMPLQLCALAALDDNYIWLVHDGCHALVIDPGEAKVVSHFLQQQQHT